MFRSGSAAAAALRSSWLLLLLLMMMVIMMSSSSSRYGRWWTTAGFSLQISSGSRGYSGGSSRSSSLEDLLPNDLNALLPEEERERVLGALGIQLLAFAGWQSEPTTNDTGSGSWRRRRRRSPSSSKAFTLRERLAFVTPSWKQQQPAGGGGAALDYATIFRQGAQLVERYHHREESMTPPSRQQATQTNSSSSGIASVAQLARLLEDRVGLDVERDFVGGDGGGADASTATATAATTTAIAALRAMLSWRMAPAALPAAAAASSNQAEQQRAQQDNNNNSSSNVRLLLVLSFGGKQRSCRGPTTDCPVGPGATNELLAATAARFVREQQQQRQQPKGNRTGGAVAAVRILAQWEVAAALWQNHNGTISNNSMDNDNDNNNNSTDNNSSSTFTVSVESFGTPGSYETTADILEAMLCAAWGGRHQRVHPFDGDDHGDADDTHSIASLQQSQSPSADWLLLAHPDHLRRVLWTAQTIVSAARQRRKRAHHYLRSTPSTRSKTNNNNNSNTTTPTCTAPPPPDATVRLRTALQPYRLDWPSTKRNNQTTLRSNNDDDNEINLFALLEPTRVRMGGGNSNNSSSNGTVITTDWYDPRHLGYFADAGNDQPWTHRRDAWILYDHWAVLKGIVTGTIDLASISIAP